jgi:NDP-sugar pyrophosphorylase family protein
MTDLIAKCLKERLKVGAFPIHEYWNDIGTPEDLEKARREFLQRELNYQKD